MGGGGGDLISQKNIQVVYDNIKLIAKKLRINVKECVVLVLTFFFYEVSSKFREETANSQI